jgi:hypothetical protein
VDSRQYTVLWLGLALILFRLFFTTQWSDLWKIIDSAGKPGGSSKNSGNGGIYSIPFIGPGAKEFKRIFAI